MRAAIYARISRVTERTTSVERQIKAAESLCEQREWTVTGIYPDEGVSGATAPDERPQMGRMLRSLGELDAIVFYRIDRLARSTVAFADLMDRCSRADVALVSVTEPMDLSTPMGRAMAEITAVFAKLERAMMRERVMDARNALRDAGKFAGGRIPFGLKPVPHPSGRGRVLVRDGDAVPILRRMYAMITAGQSTANVARWMTQHGVKTSSQRNGEETAASPWWAQSVWQILRNPQLIGHRRLPDGRVEVDADGIPVQVWEPVVSLAEWDRLQAALDGAETGPKARRHDSHWLQPLSRCAVCGYRMATSASHGRRILRCGLPNEKRHTPGPTIRLDILEPYVLNTLMEDYGWVRLVRRVWVGGADHSGERETVRHAIDRLRADREAGLYDGEEDEERFRGQMRALIARRRALESLSDDPGHWETRDTGQTLRQALEASTEAAADLMQTAGLVVRVGLGPGHSRRTMPIEDRVSVEFEDEEAAHAEDYSE